MEIRSFLLIVTFVLVGSSQSVELRSSSRLKRKWEEKEPPRFSSVDFPKRPRLKEPDLVLPVLQPDKPAIPRSRHFLKPDFKMTVEDVLEITKDFRQSKLVSSIDWAAKIRLANNLLFTKVVLERVSRSYLKVVAFEAMLKADRFVLGESKYVRMEGKDPIYDLPVARLLLPLLALGNEAFVPVLVKHILLPKWFDEGIPPARYIWLKHIGEYIIPGFEAYVIRLVSAVAFCQNSTRLEDWALVGTETTLLGRVLTFFQNEFNIEIRPFIKPSLQFQYEYLLQSNSSHRQMLAVACHWGLNVYEIWANLKACQPNIFLSALPQPCRDSRLVSLEGIASTIFDLKEDEGKNEVAEDAAAAADDDVVMMDVEQKQKAPRSPSRPLLPRSLIEMFQKAGRTAQVRKLASAPPVQISCPRRVSDRQRRLREIHPKPVASPPRPSSSPHRVLRIKYYENLKGTYYEYGPMVRFLFDSNRHAGKWEILKLIAASEFSPAILKWNPGFMQQLYNWGYYVNNG